MSGRLQAQVEQSRGLDSKLKTEVYANIDNRHRFKCIEQETAEMAVKDLDAYYSALYVQ